jgi:carboxyl-terminal processing protease
MHGENEKKDTASTKNSKKYKTKSGKELFGGGGITPDNLIGLDSIFYDTSVNKFYINNAIGNFSYKYYVKNRSSLAKYKQPNEYCNNFELENSVIQDFMKFSEKEGIMPYKLNSAEIVYLKTRIKALISRILWRDSGYYMVLNENDPTILKSKELMK